MVWDYIAVYAPGTLWQDGPSKPIYSDNPVRDVEGRIEGTESLRGMRLWCPPLKSQGWGSHIYFSYTSGERVRQPAEICFCFEVGDGNLFAFAVGAHRMALTMAASTGSGNWLA